jgi:hypothetical protein
MKEIGVRVPKSTPTLKDLENAKQVKIWEDRAKQLERFRFASIEVGLDATDALRLKKTSRKRIISTKEYRDVMERSDRGLASTKEREQLWAKWSKNKTLPPELVKQAREINGMTLLPNDIRLDKNDKYGYSVIYYALITLDTPDDIREIFKPSYRDRNISGQFVRRKKK